MDEEKKITVYIVEDYLLIRKSLIHVISKSSDFEVIGDFENAEDCIKVFKEHPSDIVIIDLGLPGMNGLQATQEIKALSPETKVVILTSHEEKKEVIAALACGASAYCLKDIESTKFNSILLDVYKGALWLHPDISNVAKDFAPKPDTTNLDNLYKTDELLALLTERELEVLKHMADGKTNSEIADSMFISTHTAKAHVGSIFSKFSVSDRVQAVVKAVKAKILD